MKNLIMKLKTVSFFVTLTVILYSGVSFSTTSNPEIHINHYEFGKIIINENVYKNDIAIWPDGEIKSGPEDMHSISISDFNELFNSGLKKLVIASANGYIRSG